MIRTYLDQEEVKEAIDLGIAQNNGKPPDIRKTNSGFHNNDIPNAFGINSGNRAYPHIIGLIGEFGLGKYMNWLVNKSVTANGDGVDFPGVEAKTIATDAKDQTLKVKEREFEKKKPRYYVLNRICVRNPRVVEHVGQISRSDFDRKKRKVVYKNEDGELCESETWQVNIIDLDVIDKDILNLGRQEAIGEQAAEDDRKRVENEAERNRNVHLEMPRSGKDFISKMRQNGVLWK